jgi:hypothetical protein
MDRNKTPFYQEDDAYEIYLYLKYTTDINIPNKIN